MVNSSKNFQNLFDDEPNSPLRVCGIDEAGRGPLAGPLVVAGVILHEDIDGLADSKRLSAKKRERLYDLIVERSRYHIVSFFASQIDLLGISMCLKMALEEIVAIFSEDKIAFLFDGNSRYGVSKIETMIKADEKIKEVSAASILAKVTRDRVMQTLASKYPRYGFERHKGYGTAEHIRAIERYGYCPAHRRSFRVKRLKRSPSLFEI